MSTPSLARAVAYATLGIGLGLPLLAQAEFIKDSKASLELRNFYMNRDYRQDSPLPAIKGKTPAETKAYSSEWAQGFLLRFESGFTEGTVGVGVDTLGLLGIRLDSGRGRSGTGLLQLDNETGKAQSEYGSMGVTGKMRISKSVLKGGTLQLKNPMVGSNDSRLLPQTFEGGSLNVLEIEGLNLNAGQLNQVRQRDSSDYDDMTMNGNAATSDQFRYVGGDYALTKELNLSYYHGELENIYSQDFAGLIYLLPLAEGEFIKADLRYADSNDSGDRDAGSIDNQSLNGMVTYGIGAHAFGLGYQRMNGDNAFPYIGGTDPYLVNYVQIGDFAGAEERSWQARYDLNFATYGIPGLSLMTRYVSGDNIDQANTASEGKEWERDTDITYLFQSEALKGLGVKWRNATYRSNLNKPTQDLDENRLIVSYTLPIW